MIITDRLVKYQCKLFCTKSTKEVTVGACFFDRNWGKTLTRFVIVGCHNIYEQILLAIVIGKDLYLNCHAIHTSTSSTSNYNKDNYSNKSCAFLFGYP